MHLAGNYLLGILPANANKAVVQSAVLSAADAAAVRTALLSDADDYYYSACISIIDGLRAIGRGFFTWSTAKLYYSVYYSARSILAWNGTAFFWIGGTPYMVTANAGNSPAFCPGKGSHNALLGCFQTVNPGHLLVSQDIDLANSLLWMKEKREDANYSIPRFCEPEVPELYEQIVDLGVRKAITAYLCDAYHSMTFDKDHAIVSFPLAALRFAGDLAKAAGGAAFSKDELGFLVKKCQESNAAVSPLMSYIRSTLK